LLKLTPWHSFEPKVIADPINAHAIFQSPLPYNCRIALNLPTFKPRNLKWPPNPSTDDPIVRVGYNGDFYFCFETKKGNQSAPACPNLTWTDLPPDLKLIKVWFWPQDGFVAAIEFLDTQRRLKATVGLKEEWDDLEVAITELDQKEGIIGV